MIINIIVQVLKNGLSEKRCKLMVNFGAVILGFVLAIIFSIIGVVTGLWNSAIGIFVASLIIGYRVDGSIFSDGLLNGALIGVIGAIILALIGFIFNQLSSLLSTYVGLTSLNSIILAVAIGAVGGAIGSLIALIVIKIRKR